MITIFVFFIFIGCLMGAFILGVCGIFAWHPITILLGIAMCAVSSLLLYVILRKPKP